MAAGGVRIFGKEIVDAKLLMAAPRILEQNRLMVKALLGYIKPLVVAQTPTGPGHFGFHLRDRYETDVKSEGIRTIGTLKAPAQGYWREFGTLASFNKHGGSVSEASFTAALGGHMGERPHMTAHRTLTGARRLINFYYGGLATWWRA